MCQFSYLLQIGIKSFIEEERICALVPRPPYFPLWTPQVTKEERRVARDKMVYASLKQAWTVNKEEPQGRSAAGMNTGGVEDSGGGPHEASSAIMREKCSSVLCEVQWEMRCEIQFKVHIGC